MNSRLIFIGHFSLALSFINDTNHFTIWKYLHLLGTFQWYKLNISILFLINPWNNTPVSFWRRRIDAKIHYSNFDRNYRKIKNRSYSWKPFLYIKNTLCLCAICISKCVLIFLTLFICILFSSSCYSAFDFLVKCISYYCISNVCVYFVIYIYI